MRGAFQVAAVCLLLAAAAAGDLEAQSAGMVQDLRVPLGTRVIAPGADTSPSIAAFSGVWGGRWHGASYGQQWAVDSLVVVERLAANGDARIIYVLGDAPPYIRAGFWRFSAKIANNRLTWTWGNSRFEFAMDSGSLKGRRFINDIQDAAQISMSRLDLAAVVPPKPTTPPDLPLPPNIESVAIQAPESGVPNEFAAFVGKWGGYWEEVLASNLIVESVTPAGDARGVYIWDKGSTFDGGGSKFRARIQRGVLAWGNPSGGIGFEFRLDQDGTLAGERYNKGSYAGAVVMVRLTSPLATPRTFATPDINSLIERSPFKGTRDRGRATPSRAEVVFSRDGTSVIGRLNRNPPGRVEINGNSIIFKYRNDDGRDVEVTLNGDKEGALTGHVAGVDGSFSHPLDLKPSR